MITDQSLIDNDNFDDGRYDKDEYSYKDEYDGDVDFDVDDDDDEDYNNDNDVGDDDDDDDDVEDDEDLWQEGRLVWEQQRIPTQWMQLRFILYFFCNGYSCQLIFLFCTFCLLVLF